MKKVILAFKSLISLSLLTLASCSNFLEGDNIKKTIDDKIAYENSPSITVRISGDEKAIEFISNKGDLQLKATDKITIEFRLNDSEYSFQGWSVVSKNDETLDCSSNVIIENSSNGNLYKTNFTLLKNSTDLIVSAKCHLKPSVLNFEPKYYPTGISCYRPIKITFNQPINEEDLKDFNNITITNNLGESIHEYFNLPVSSEDHKTYTISPVMNKIKELLESNTTYDITVSLADGLREIAEIPEVTKGTKFTYRIGDIKDSLPPTLTSLKVFTTVKNLETEEIETKELKQDILPEEFWTSEENKKYYEYNHITGNTVKIKFTGTDDESGIKALYVKEILLHNKDAQEYGETYLAEKCEAVISETEANNFESNIFTYTLRSKNDGLISLEFYATDYDDHISKSLFCGVTRDLTADLEFVPDTRENHVKSELFFRKTVTSGEFSGRDAYEQLNTAENKQGFEFCYFGDTFMKPKNSPSALENRFNFKITYRDEDSQTETEIYRKTNATRDDIITPDFISCKVKTIVRNPDQDTFVKFYMENAYSQSAEFTCTIPKSQKPQVISSVYLDFNNYNISNKVLFFTPELAAKTIYFCQVKNKDEPDSAYGDITSMKSIEESRLVYELEGNKTYKIYMMYTLDEIFYSCANDALVISTDSMGRLLSNKLTLPVPKIKEIACTPDSENSGTHKVSILYENEGSPDYNYNLIYSFQAGESDKDNPNSFEHAPDTFRVYLQASSKTDFTVKSGHEYEISFDIVDKSTGDILKSSASDNSNPHTIDASYDNIAPTLGNTYISSRNSSPNQAIFYLDAADNSGNLDLSNIEYWVYPNTNEYRQLKFSEDYLTLENKKILDMTGKNTAYFDLDVPKGGYYTIFYKIYDQNKNYVIGQNLVSSVISGKISEITKNEDELILVPAFMTERDRMLATPEFSSIWYYDSEWKETDSDVDSDVIEDSTNNTSSNTERKFSYNFIAEKDKFFKISAAYLMHSVDDSKPYSYNHTVYIVPEYHLDSTKTVKKKNILDMGANYLLFINAPTMVRTLYSSTDWGNDAYEWATRGIEADVTVEDTDFTYVPAKNKVPQGKYWCVVANYADGSCDMSKVEYQP